jgi:hypothetical protein
MLLPACHQHFFYARVSFTKDNFFPVQKQSARVICIWPNNNY